MSSDQSPARRIALRLIDAHRRDGTTGDTTARATAAACDKLYKDLAQWVGPDGCHALFARALAQARREHDALEQIQLRPGSDPYVDAVPETIIAHGGDTTAAALGSMLIRLVELLGRLIGDDMAMKLIEQSIPDARGEAKPLGKREEA